MSIQDAAIQSWQNAARKAKAEGREMFTRESRCRDARYILWRNKKRDELINFIIACSKETRGNNENKRSSNIIEV
jgi:hypothetical protein